MDGGTISIICTIVCCIISVTALVRSGKKDTSDDAKTQGQMLEKIDQVHSSVKELTVQYIELVKYQSGSEERLRTLFSDMHNIKERIDRLERK